MMGHKNRLAVFLMAMLALMALTGVAAADGYYSFELEEISTEVEMDRDSLVEDKPLVVFVWSAECPHCKRQMPYVNAMYKKLDLDKVNFVSCVVDKNRKMVCDYIEEKDISFPVLDGNSGKLADFYTKEGWPTTFVFARGGQYMGKVDTTGSKYAGEVMDLVEKAQKK